MARTPIAVILLAGAFESRAESGAEPISESEEQHDMTALAEFATRYAAAWSSQDPVAFAAILDEDGLILECHGRMDDAEYQRQLNK